MFSHTQNNLYEQNWFYRIDLFPFVFDGTGRYFMISSKIPVTETFKYRNITRALREFITPLKKVKHHPPSTPLPPLIFLFLFLHNFLSFSLEKNKNFAWSYRCTASSPIHITPSNLIPVLFSPSPLVLRVSFAIL